jgi:hypothetical protein
VKRHILNISYLTYLWNENTFFKMQTFVVFFLEISLNVYKVFNCNTLLMLIALEKKRCWGLCDTKSVLCWFRFICTWAQLRGLGFLSWFLIVLSCKHNVSSCLNIVVPAIWVVVSLTKRNNNKKKTKKRDMIIIIIIKTKIVKCKSKHNIDLQLF